MLITKEIKKDIERIVSFLNVTGVDIEEKYGTRVSVGIGIKNIGVGGLLELRKRLELELSFIISDYLYEKLGYSISVTVDISCQ